MCYSTTAGHSASPNGLNGYAYNRSEPLLWVNTSKCCFNAHLLYIMCVRIMQAAYIGMGMCCPHGGVTVRRSFEIPIVLLLLIFMSAGVCKQMNNYKLLTKQYGVGACVAVEIGINILLIMLFMKSGLHTVRMN